MIFMSSIGLLYRHTLYLVSFLEIISDNVYIPKKTDVVIKLLDDMTDGFYI